MRYTIYKVLNGKKLYISPSFNSFITKRSTWSAQKIDNIIRNILQRKKSPFNLDEIYVEEIWDCDDIVRSCTILECKDCSVLNVFAKKKDKTVTQNSSQIDSEKEQPLPKIIDAVTVSQATIKAEELTLLNVDQTMLVLTQAAEIIQHRKAYKQQLSNAVSQSDLKLSDIYHSIEFSNFNAAQGFALAKLMKETLIERRKAKDALQMFDVFMTNIDDTDKRLQTHESVVAARSYNPRIMLGLDYGLYGKNSK